MWPRDTPECMVWITWARSHCQQRWFQYGCLFYLLLVIIDPTSIRIKNALFHGIINEEVYVEQSFGFVAQGEYDRICCL